MTWWIAALIAVFVFDLAFVAWSMLRLLFSSERDENFPPLFTVGTRSVLFGAHCFFLHPWFVAYAWWALYGFPWDPRLWVAFFVHDLGYIGKPNMNGPEGETHPILGAHIMSRLFDSGFPRQRWIASVGMCSDPDESVWQKDGFEYGRWGRFCLLHSRYYAKSLETQPSRLCMADKLAIALTPAWLYIPMVYLTGEVHEYMAHAQHRSQGNTNISEEERQRMLSQSAWEWYAGIRSYCRRYALEHIDGKPDTWTTSSTNRARLENGKWQ